MRLAYVIAGICALCVVVMTADAVATDFWTWTEYRQRIAEQRAEIDRLQDALLTYQRNTTDAALAAN